ncbi:hypothetical protein ACQ4LE_001365 [Meloidogyne hapla]|uniref:Uncharacterized protein n=1 Tax=Meloidogyne hapla TaxID=6305 RepID=A0A1I8BGI3_MELHA
MPSIHFCSIQLNISEDNCCQLIKLLNIPNKVPFCLPKLQGNNNLEINKNYTLENNNSTNEAPITSLLYNITTTIFPQTSTPFSVKYNGGAPAMPFMNLKVAPSEAPEEHLTFLFGIFMLISMAVICTLFLMKLAKVNSIQSSTSTSISPRLRFSPRSFARSLAAADYSLMLCIPRSTSTNSNISNNSKAYRRPLNCQSSLNQRQRRSQAPLVVLLGSSFKCDHLSKPESLKASSTSRKGRSSVSIVSSTSMNALLPQIKTSNSFTSNGELALLNASTSNNNFSNELTPPPCYEELEELTKNKENENLK